MSKFLRESEKIAQETSQYMPLGLH